MRAIFGVVALLVVLAIVGLLAKKQLQAVSHVGASLPPAQGTDPATVAPAASTAQEQSRQLRERVVEDANKALQQGAARSESADK